MSEMLTKTYQIKSILYNNASTEDVLGCLIEPMKIEEFGVPMPFHGTTGSSKDHV